MTINYQKLFGDMGLMIRSANLYRTTFTDAIDTQRALRSAELSNGRYVIANDATGQLNGWRLSGALEGINTDAAGLFHVSLTAVAGTATVSLYKDAAKAGGDLVAQGTGPASGTVSVILTEQTGSGLSGTVQLTYSVDDTDITLIPPFRGTAHNERYEQMAQTDGANRQALTGWTDGEVAHARAYINEVLAMEIDSTFGTTEEILTDLVDKMTADSQSIDGNSVAATGPTTDPDNAGGGSLGTVTVNQMARSQSFRVECVAADTVGSELWDIYGSVDGLLTDRATTGVAYSSNGLGGVGFTISVGGANFAVGDRFSFETTSSDEGTIQTFFRDRFAAALPSNGASSETVSDTLAE